jgi:4-diphosphocytidyl-2-C-methyl-D-erythritol kinase
MKTIHVRSPAKLNLVLDVLGKRPDGYHELRTIFERIDLSDRMTLTSRNDGSVRIVCADPQVPKDIRNLAFQAAELLQTECGIRKGVTITIDKRIPVAAGLAGGSSNAAAVLLGLNRLWDLKLGQSKLVALGARLGSDVAFFIYGVSFALGEGRGEKIRPILRGPKLWHVLVTPRFKMLTKEVFSRVKLRLTNKKDNVNILLPLLRKNPAPGIGQALANDLEPAILSLRPDFVRLKKKLLDAGACGVCFSGSGPSIFALARSKEHAGQIKARFDRRYARVFVVSTL